MVEYLEIGCNYINKIYKIIYFENNNASKESVNSSQFLFF